MVAAVSTVVFFPEGAYGPTNNCVGIGQVLRERGHRVVFVIEESFVGSLEAQGFEERLMRLGPPPEVEEEPGQFWKDFIRETAPVFRKPTIEQLTEFIEPTWRALCDGARYVDDRLREIFDDVEPDVIVEDNVVCFPAIHHSGRPWARIVSCNPLEIKDPEIPPVFSGYPAGDRTGWDEFRRTYASAIAGLHEEFAAFCGERGAGRLPDGEFVHESDWLNLYSYPAEADYRRDRALAPTWHRLDSTVRATDADWELPELSGLRASSIAESDEASSGAVDASPSGAIASGVAASGAAVSAAASASGAAGMEEAALAAGFDRHFTKPADPAALEAALTDRA